MPLTRSLFATWDAANPSRRVLLAGLAIVVLLAIALPFGAAPLTSTIARAESHVAHSRLMLEIARERVADSESLARASPSVHAGDLRAAVERVLSRHELRATPVAAGSSEGRYAVVIAAGRFDSIVAALDALARDEGVHLLEATMTALVEPGAVRADLTFAR
jgi:type II secretory pathway component PulM